MKRCLRLVSILLGAGLPLCAQEATQPADTPLAPGSSQTVGERVPNVSGFEVLSKGTPTELRNYPFRILAGIRNHWYPQLAELKKSANWKRGTAVIEFEINREGSVGQMRAVASAGDASLDAAASQAISAAAPFPPCPRPTLGRHSGFVIISATTSRSARKHPCVTVPTWARMPTFLSCIRRGTGSRRRIPPTLPTLSILRRPAR